MDEAVRQRWLEIGLVLAAMAALYAFLAPRWVGQWYNDPDYSHGFLVPLMSVWFAWTRRDELKRAEVSFSAAGLLLFLAGLGLLLAGRLMAENFTMRVSLVPTLAGATWFLFGGRVLRILALPLAFLVFMVPLPEVVYDTISFPLKLMVSDMSVALLKLMGLPVWQEGNIIMFPDVTLEVADACSGLRSLVSLAALGVAYAFVLPFSTWQRVVLVLSTVPIAVATNMFRVVATGVLAQNVSPKAAMGFFHEFAGIAVFILALALLVTLGSLLRRFS